MKYRINKYIRVCIVSCNIVSFDLECRLLILWKFCWARHNKWCILMAFVCFPVGWSFCLVIVNLFVWLSCCLHFFLLMEVWPCFYAIFFLLTVPLSVRVLVFEGGEGVGLLLSRYRLRLQVPHLARNQWDWLIPPFWPMRGRAMMPLDQSSRDIVSR